ncbi:translocation/assembly module TamB domain-containing protein [Calothrix sp. CCY 0018]|uniref:translocation/assembly module TamB domain-containing protein n=1 Tax=Calothrix sp. CCY 0018 TaxID=3103864 RepID=UPI0039C63AFE
MTPPNNPQDSTSTPQSQRRRRVWLRNAVKIFGASLVGLGVAGYFGLDYWIRRKLPPLLDQQLTEFVNRPVKVGDVKFWSLSGIRLENSSIPATANDPNYVKAKAVDIGINPIPLLFTQTLPLRITLIEPDVYVEQDKQGEWVRLNLDTGEGELPFDIDAKINLRRAKVAVLPQALKDPFAVEDINGYLNYSQNKAWQLQYGINAPVVKGKVDIDGVTQLTDYKSRINARIDNLSLPDLSNYVKDNLPVTIPSGLLNADLEIDLPGLSKFAETQVVGSANLQKLQVKSPQLKVPLNATANLQFDGQSVSFKDTRANYGNLIAAVSGVADLDKGFDLKVNTNSFGIGNLLQTTALKSPVNINGNLQAELLLKGDVENPILLGNVVSQKGIVVDKTAFSKVNTVFGGNFKQFVLQEFRATPATGGNIIAKGEVSFPKSLPEVKDFSKSKIALDFDARIANPGAIVANYGVTDDMLKLGRLLAEGEVNGTVANPRGVLSWKLPQAEADIVGRVSGSGNIRLAQNLITLNNTTLRTAEGKVNVDGRANLATNNWNASVNANTLALNPFLAKVENVGERIQDTRLFLQRGNVQLAGSLNNFNPASIRGNADLNLNVNQGNLAVNGNVNQGILTANANVRGIGLNKLVPELPLAVTVANTQVNVSGRLNELINYQSIDSLNSFRASVDGNLILPEVKGRGRVDFNGSGNFATKNWNLVANANSLPISTLLSAEQRKQFRLNQLNQPVTLRRGNVRLAGNLDIINDFDFNKVNGNANLNLAVNNGRLLVDGNLNQGILQANVNANSIRANAFLPELPIPVTVANTRVNLSGRLQDLLELESFDSNNLDKLNSFRATANGRLIVPGSRGDINFNANGNLATNNLQAVVNANRISLNQLLPDTPLPVTVNNSRVNVTGKINQLLANNFDNLNADVNANLGVAQGSVRAIANFNNGRIASNINANNVNTPLLCRSFDIQCPELSQLSAKLNLTGEVKPLLEGNPILIQANQADVTTQGQQLNANGQIVIVPSDDGISSWNVATDLNVDVNSNLAKLPLQSIARELDEEAIPKIQGRADFSGRLIGRNLISAPFAPGNLRLAGNLNLRNLALDQIAFQPLLQGPVDVNLGNSIEFDLQGKTDRIAANLQPCTRQDCLSPYLPTFFDLKQGVNTQNPILLSGVRKGDVLDINLKNASLSLLNLVPVVEETIGAPVDGKVTGNLDVNLFNLATAGNIQVENPAIGAVKAKEFVADFSYDGEIARVDAATLQIGETEYALQGALNLESQDINGRLVANGGRVQDIFAAINVFNLEDFQGGVNSILNPEYGDAANLPTQAVGKPEAPILEQLRLLAEITRLIQQQAALQQDENTIQFDITGEYDAEVAVAGKLTNPQVNFQLLGDNWQWRPQEEYVTVIPKKGVVVKQNQAIDISQVVASGSYNNGIIKLDPARVNVNGGLIAVDGTLELDGFKSLGTVKVANLPVELAERFVDLPVDVGGKFNLQANLGGNAFKPDIPQGAFSLVNGTINEKPLGELAGNFNYIDSIGRLVTTPNSVVKVDATVAYPLQPNRQNTVAVQAKIDNQAFQLIDAFTQDQVQWVDGNGEIAIAINGDLNIEADTIRGILGDLVATSAINIENATIKTKQLESNIKLTAVGNANLQQEIIQVEGISGSLAQSPFSIAGNLPIFQPQSNQPLTVILGARNIDSEDNIVFENIEPKTIKLKGLYNGEIASLIEVSRTALNPVISGDILLQQGRVEIPKREQEENNEESTAKLTNAANKIATQSKQLNQPQQVNNLPINPTFDNFKVTLGRGFRFSRSLPRVNFRMAGDITVNGGLDNLRGDGQIELKRGSLFLLDNSFFITRDRKQVVTFSPNRSLLNPQLDVELQTTVVDAPNFDRLQANNNEIRDDIVAAANPEQIDVRILVEGEANQLLASLGNSASNGDACITYQRNIRLSELGTNVTESENKLRTVANCINANSKVSIQTKDLLDNPAVALTSTPSRSNSEILSLLGNRTFAALQKLEQQLTSGNETELLESLVLDYLVAPLETEITQEFLYQAQKPINSLGKSIGLTRLQVFPSVTGLKDINENSSARFVYDYEAGEFRVLYEARF